MQVRQLVLRLLVLRRAHNSSNVVYSQVTSANLAKFTHELEKKTLKSVFNKDGTLTKTAIDEAYEVQKVMRYNDKSPIKIELSKYASKHPHLDLHRKLTSQSLNELALPVDQKLIDTMKSKGWRIDIVKPGTDDYRYFTKYNIDASINTGVPKHILIKEGAPKSALLEEYLHGTQLKLGLMEKYGSKDFMLKHSKMLGLDNPHDIKLLQQLKIEEIDRLNQARRLS